MNAAGRISALSFMVLCFCLSDVSYWKHGREAGELQCPETRGLAIYKCSIGVQVTELSSPEHWGMGCWDLSSGPPANRCCSLHVFSGLGPVLRPPTIPGWGKALTLCQVFLLPQAVMCLSNDWQLWQACGSELRWDKGGGVSWLSVKVIFIKEI